MSMKRINQLFGGVMLAVFLFMAYTSRTTLTYWSEEAIIGAGPGLFPFWVSIILVGLTLYWLIQVTLSLGEEMPENFIPPPHERILVLLVYIDMIMFVVIMDYVGFSSAIFLFLMIMVTVLGKRTLREMVYYVIFSAGITAFFIIVFGRWLEVPFPKSQIEILKALGL